MLSLSLYKRSQLHKKPKIDMISEYLTLVSPPDTPSDFSTQFDTTIPLDGGFEVGLIDIFHGGVCNVCSENNHFYISSFKGSSSSYKNLNPSKNADKLTIPTGYYKNTILVVEAIQKSIDTFTKSGGRGGLWFNDGDDVNQPHTQIAYISKTRNDRRLSPIGPYADGEVVSVKLNINHKDLKFYQPKFGRTLLSLLGKSEGGLFSELHIGNTELESHDEIGLIYTSLIQSSRLNNKNTNLLAVVPLGKSFGSNYIHYSVTNLTYYPVAVTSFEQIRIQIRNVLQNPVHIKHVGKTERALYPTILTLHLRKRQ